MRHELHLHWWEEVLPDLKRTREAGLCARSRTVFANLYVVRRDGYADTHVNFKNPL